MLKLAPPFELAPPFWLELLNKWPLRISAPPPPQQTSLRMTHLRTSHSQMLKMTSGSSDNRPFSCSSHVESPKNKKLYFARLNLLSTFSMRGWTGRMLFFFSMQNGRYMIKVYRIATELSYNRMVKAKKVHDNLLVHA